MLPAVALLVAALFMAPVSEGNVLARDVSNWTVDVDWTEVLPGIEMMVRGTYHDTTMVFLTADPTVYRVVVLSTFRGSLGVRFFDPDLGLVTLIVTNTVSHAKFAGTMVLDDLGTLVPKEGLLLARTLGTTTLSVGDYVMEESVNELGLAKYEDATPVWVRVGVPMGWPFQVLFPEPNL